MQIKTILNRIQKHRGFVYGTVQLEEQIGGLALTVDIAPASRAIGRGVRAAAQPGAQCTTGWRRGASSSCRCGACACSSST